MIYIISLFLFVIILCIGIGLFLLVSFIKECQIKKNNDLKNYSNTKKEPKNSFQLPLKDNLTNSFNEKDSLPHCFNEKNIETINQTKNYDIDYIPDRVINKF